MNKQFKTANDLEGNGQGKNQQPFQPQIPPQPQYQQPQYQQQVPPQPQYQQPQYQQQVPPQPQYQQPQYQQPQYQQQMDNTYKKNNNNKIIIVGIIAVIVAALVVAGIFLVPKLFKGSSNNSASGNEANTAAISTSASATSNTPEEAAQEAMEEQLTQLENNKSKLKNAAIKQMAENVIDESLDVMIDSIEYKVKSSKIDGDTATVSIETTMIDSDELSQLISKLTTYNSGDIKKLANQCGTTSKTSDMKLHKENGKWVAEAKDIEGLIDAMNIMG